MAAKLSMAEFKALRQAKAAVATGRAKEREGDIAAARRIYEEAVSAAPGSVSARLALAIHVWGDAATQADLEEVERVLRKAVSIDSGSKPEQEAAVIASNKLCLLLIQEGKKEQARTLLVNRGCEFRLSDQVLRYELSPDPVESGGASAAEERKSFVQAADNALPSEMLSFLQSCFHRGGPFWTEHGYHCEETGYFSYLHPLMAEPCTCFEEVIHHVWRTAALHFPAVKDAKYCEWWSHCRPHASGHQMHFDSDDEGVGGVRNPIISTVIYLTDGVGGPTLVTDQRITDSNIATKGWMVLPKLNRMVMFDGKTLHGVVPGRGIAAQSPGGEGARRLTLMLAFWREINERPGDCPGASRPFPTAGKTQYTWCAPMHEKKEGWESMRSGHAHSEVLSIPEVGRVWERVDGGGGGADGMPDYSACFQGF